MGIVVPGVLSDIVSAGLWSSGIIPIVQLNKTAIPEKIRLPVNTRGLAGCELFFRRNQPGVLTGADVCPYVSRGASQSEHPYRPYAHREVGSGVFEPVVAPLPLQGPWSGTVVIDLGVIPMNRIKIDEQMLASQFGKDRKSV